MRHRSGPHEGLSSVISWRWRGEQGGRVLALIYGAGHVEHAQLRDRLRRRRRRLRAPPSDLPERARRSRLRGRRRPAGRPGARDRLRHRSAHPRAARPGPAGHGGRARSPADRAGAPSAGGRGRGAVHHRSPRGGVVAARPFRRHALGVGDPLGRSRRELAQDRRCARRRRDPRSHLLFRVGGSPERHRPTSAPRRDRAGRARPRGGVADLPRPRANAWRCSRSPSATSRRPGPGWAATRSLASTPRGCSTTWRSRPSPCATNTPPRS